MQKFTVFACVFVVGLAIGWIVKSTPRTADRQKIDPPQIDWTTVDTVRISHYPGPDVIRDRPVEAGTYAVVTVENNGVVASRPHPPGVPREIVSIQVGPLVALHTVRVGPLP